MLVGSEIRVQKKLKARKKEQNFFWGEFLSQKAFTNTNTR
jgi:hypothetical protein